MCLVVVHNVNIFRKLMLAFVHLLCKVLPPGVKVPVYHIILHLYLLIYFVQSLQYSGILFVTPSGVKYVVQVL